MTGRKAFLFSIISWSIAIGLFIIIRFGGTGWSPYWLTNNIQLFYGWMTISLLLGFLFWLSIRIENHPVLRRRSYVILIGFKVIFLVFFSYLTGLIVFLIALFGGQDLETAWEGYIKLESGPAAIYGTIYIVFAGMVISFIWQMVIKNGPNVLINLILGKYHKPREEYRVFLFLDLKGSTGIAEQIGHIQYSRLIQDCFADLTESAIEHDVEIYQYVGDEAVLTWETGKGVHRNNCIYTFFDFQKTLLNKEKYYIKQYGIHPTFKAGINSGMVVVTEVGVIKREIAYHSDVLNTAARIQGKCNELEAQILISEEIKNTLQPDNNLIFEDAGIFELRGKRIGVRLYKVSQTGIPQHLR